MFRAQAKRASSQNVPLIMRDAMSLQEGKELILERDSRVVRLLVQYVGLDVPKIGLANGECGVARLPREGLRSLQVFVHPLRGISLDPAQHVRHAGCWMEGREQMNMIRRSPDRNETSVFTPDDSTDVITQARLEPHLLQNTLYHGLAPVTTCLGPYRGCFGVPAGASQTKSLSSLIAV